MPTGASSEQAVQDNRLTRGEITKQALMRAAEKLIADRGIENVSIRDIVQEAGQKNESALQYHFKNLAGLITALHAARDEQVQAKRQSYLAELSDRSSPPSLRDICEVMVAPAFELARAQPDYRRYVKAFGHEITLADESAVKFVNRKGGQSAQATGELLRAALPELDRAAFERRLDGALRFISASMVHHAQQKNAFRGLSGDLFYHSLIDALTGLLSAPVSPDTRAIVQSIDDN